MTEINKKTRDALTKAHAANGKLVGKGESESNESLCGDINQGLGDNLEILQVSGHPDGIGLPNYFIVRDKRTGRVGEYTFSDA